MTAFVADLDCGVFKALRSAERKKSLSKKRADFARTIEQREQRASDPAFKGCSVPMAHRRAHPHGAARAAARTWMAKGQVESSVDVPSISMGRVGERKPCVSPLLSFAATPVVLSWEDQQNGVAAPMLQEAILSEKVSCPKEQEFDSDVDTTASEAAGFEARDSPASTFATETPLVEDLANDTFELDAAALDEDMPETASSDADNDAQAIDWLSAPETTAESQDDIHVDATPKEQASIQGPSHRELVMRQVIDKLREQALAAEKEVQAEKERACELEKQVAGQKQAEKSLSKKDLVMAEKQRSAQLRKQRNQAAHAQAIKEKAELALQEAEEIRSKAEVEAAEAHARLLAEASKAAQEQVDAQVQAVLVAAKAEVDAFKFDSEEAAQQAQELKAEAELQLAQAKSNARKEHLAAEAAKAEAETLRAEAELAARAIREAALNDAKAFKARVEVQMQEKLDAASEKAQQEMQARIAEQVELVKEAAFAEAKRLAVAKEAADSAAALKLGKAMEQQRSKQFRKQAVQERQEEQSMQRELDAARARIEEQARSERERAMAEIASMKAKAKADAKLARQRALAAARAEAKAKELAETLAARAEAETSKEETIDEVASEEEVEDLQCAQERPRVAEDGEAEDWQLLSTSAEVVENEWDMV